MSISYHARGRLLSILAVTLALASIAFTSSLEIGLARSKPFWVDEGFEIANTCPQPMVPMLLRGALGECNPAPLYPVIQGILVRAVTRLDEGILVKYRALSLAGAALTLSLLSVVLCVRLGPPPALLALAVVSGQPLFHHYAAENRAYMTWLLAFLLLLLTAAEASSRSWERVSVRGIVALVGACLLATLVALPASFQAAATLAVCGLVWARVPAGPGGGHARRAWWLATGLLLLVLGAHYASVSPCREYEGGHLDLLKSQDPIHLLYPVWELLWPPGLVEWPVNVLVVAGGLAPIILWPERARWTRRTRFAFVLALLCLVQVAGSFAIALAIVRAGYLFLPRLFLYLLLCRGLLAALGCWLLVARLAQARTLRRSLLVAAWAGACFLLVVSLDRLQQTVGEHRAASRSRAAADSTCRAWAGELRLFLEPAAEDLAFAPNAVARLGEVLGRCGWRPATESSYVLALGMPGGPQFRVSDVPPVGALPLRLCGRAVVLSPPP